MYIFILLRLKRNNFLIFFSFFVSVACCYGQKNIDSIQLILGDKLYQQADLVYQTHPDSTVILINQAAEHYKKSRDWEKYINCLNTLATIHYLSNNLDLYLENTKLAILESKLYLSTRHNLYATALNNLNAYYSNLGDFKKSISTLKESLNVFLDNDANKDDLSFAYTNIGIALTKKGDYDEALKYLEIGYSLRRDTFLKNPSPYLEYNTIQSELSIAWTYFKNDQLKEALKLYDSSYETLKKMLLKGNYNSKLIHRGLIELLQNSSQIHLLLDNSNLAKSKIEEAFLYQKNDDSYKKSYSYELLGNIFMEKASYEEAIIFYEKALGLAAKFYAKANLPFYARKHTRLAEANEEIEEYTEALKHYQKSLQILSPAFTSNDYAKNPDATSLYSMQDALDILNGKGQVLWKKYITTKDQAFLTQAGSAYQCGIKVVREIRQSVITKSAKNTLSEKTIAIYEGAIRAKLEQYKHTKEESYLLEAFALAESNKSQLLLESNNEQAALGIKGLPDSLVQRDEELRLKIAYFQKKVIKAKANTKTEDREQVEKWQSEIFVFNEELQNLSDYFEQNYPRYYDLKYQNDLAPVGEWQKVLGTKHQALLEYFVGEKITYVFTLWSDGCNVFEIENQKDISNAIEKLRNSIYRLPSDDAVLQNYKDFTSSSFYLYQNIFAPALNLIPKDIKNLKIIPDGKFNYIPFELLLRKQAPDNEPFFFLDHLDYALSKYNISYDYSATWMYKNEQNSERNYTKDFIAYAPSFKKRSNNIGARACVEGDLYYLECSEEEVVSVNKLLNGDVRSGELARKTTFEDEASKYRIIHMATHACADEGDPLFNKIFLSDDYLSNADLYNTRLNAELVVLSACNTGSGKLVKGEGVLSLARGFVQAGCGSSIVSRWSVDDCATSEIMKYFYEGLKAGKGKDEALRMSKMKYLKGADKLSGHPYYWGAFVGYGDMEAMELGGFEWWWILLGIGAVVVVLLGFWKGKFNSPK